MGLIMKKGVPYASGSEIPQGGTKGQVLAKASNISGDFEWVNGGGGSGNTVLEPSRNAGELLGMKVVDGDKELRVFTDGQVIVIDGADSESFNLATQNALNTKQDTLESGTNIKKIGNHDLLGSGAINVATVNNKSLLDGGNVSTAKITYDAEYQTTQIRDAESNAEIGINKVDGNTLNINEYAPDSRGQSQEVFNMNIPTKGYVDGKVGDLTTLTTTDKTSAVGAINELDAAVKGLGEPFRVKNWASNTLNVEIPCCTEDIGNGSIAKMVFSIDAVEGADYQIVGMIAYEVFDAESGGNRINCWPVCQFTGNGQKELSVRWMCGGTTRKTAKRINAWVLLKHR